MTLSPRTNRRLSWAIVGLAGFVVVFLSGCAVGSTTGARPDPKPAATTPVDQLATLTIAEPGTDAMGGYSLAEFGGWKTVGGKGCDVRTKVLVIAGTDSSYGPRCTVNGTWTSAYDGKTLTKPAQVAVDRIVPLAEAWRSGASRWDAAGRNDFANDEANLRVTSKASTRAKGDRPPNLWRPATGQCDYASAWISVKANSDLTITQPEHDALDDMLATC
jgi:hypothetical protein